MSPSEIGGLIAFAVVVAVFGFVMHWWGKTIDLVDKALELARERGEKIDELEAKLREKSGGGE